MFVCTTQYSKKDSNTIWYERTLLGASFFSGVSQQLGEGVQAKKTAPLKRRTFLVLKPKLLKRTQILFGTNERCSELPSLVE